MYTIIITAYHFGSDEKEKYQRLLCSLQRTLAEIGDQGNVVLVANGTEDKALPPAAVIAKLNDADGRVLPIELPSNRQNVGALNAGVDRALQVASPDADVWIGQVQSSVVLHEGWLDAIKYGVRGHQGADAAFGRIVDEEHHDRIWADGHYLSAGRTPNEHYKKSPRPGLEAVPSDTFPCLSAAIFRRDVVSRVVAKYGTLVCEQLPHYGDCTDVALRAVAVGARRFAFSPGAVARKRWPSLDCRRYVAQLLAATWYYEERTEAATGSLRSRIACTGARDEILTDAARRAGKRYAHTGAQPPPGILDRDTDWRLASRT